MKLVDDLKNELIGNIYSQTEVDNIMSKHDYFFIECEEYDEKNKKKNNKSNNNEVIIKYTNSKNQLWIKTEKDDSDFMVTNIVFVTKKRDVPTEVDPFHTFEDLNNVLTWLKENKKPHYWFCACLMTALGRRVEDTVSLKWSDLFLPNGEYKTRMNTLKEEKTKKILGVRINKFAKACIDEYCKMENISPIEQYDNKIFHVGSPAFRKMTKEAVKAVGIEYPVSTHSFRKYYANTMYELQQGDIEAIKIVQFQLGHADEYITKRYIGHIDKKTDKYNSDYADYLTKVSNGEDYLIDHLPNVSLKTDDLRNILIAALKMENTMENLSELLNMVDKLRVM